jgi:hypothetical protein
MKLVSTTALVLSAAAIGVSLGADVAPEMDPHHQFVQESTRALRGEAQAAMSPGAAKDGAIATFQIGQAIAPLLGDMFKKKKCHQLACWIATTTEACGMTAANQVQRELTKGRNSYSVEKVEDGGMWVRYWRTQFWPPDRGDVADGTCGDGTKFVVTNCMGDHKVHC